MAASGFPYAVVTRHSAYAGSGRGSPDRHHPSRDTAAAARTPSIHNAGRIATARSERLLIMGTDRTARFVGQAMEVHETTRFQR